MIENQQKETPSTNIVYNGIEYSLNEEDKTASVIGLKNTQQINISVYIPKTIIHNLKEYTITSISPNSFQYKPIKSITIDPKSQIRTFEAQSLSYTTFESLTIPPQLSELNTGWCQSTPRLTKLDFIPGNPYLKFYNEQLLLKRSKIDQDDYDCLLFCVRDACQVTVPKCVRHIKSCAFSGCNLLTVVEFEKDSKLETIEKDAFSSTAIKTISIPSTVKYIGENSFYLCNKLEQVIISKDSKLEIIDEFAFAYTLINNLTIPKNVIDIKRGWCISTTRFKNIEVSPDNQYFKLIENKYLLRRSSIEKNEYNQFVFCVRDAKEAFIPNYIEHICSCSFDFCKNLQSVEFQSGSKLLTIDEYSFQNTAIKSIAIPSTVTKIGLSAFSDTSSLKQVNFEDNSQLQIIDKQAFLCSGLLGISIPSGVTIIDDNAFDCRDFQKVDFQSDSKLQIIGKLAFEQTKLSSITIPSQVIKICQSAFEKCTKLSQVEFESDSKLQIIESSAFANTIIQEISIPSTVIKIGEKAFDNCNNLDKITIPDDSQLQTIEDSAFYNNVIEELSIPSKLVELKKGWCSCTQYLDKIIISPENPRYCSIDNLYVFGKSSMELDYYDSLIFCSRQIETFDFSIFNSYSFINIKIIGPHSFAFTLIDEIKIPSSVTLIDTASFANCKYLKKIAFDEDSMLETIDYNAFAGSAISSISFPSKLKKIETFAFVFCSNLKIIEFKDDSLIESIGHDPFKWCKDPICMAPARLSNQ